MIVDTSFVLDVVDDVDAAVETERELEESGIPLIFPAMTVLELYVGVGKVANSPAERRQVEAVLSAYPIVDVTPSIARRAGRLIGERVARGSGGPGIGIADAVVAATALERDEPVLTSDTDFEALDGVEIEQYR